MPQPVIRKGWVDIDRRAPAVHAALASISNVPTNIGAAQQALTAVHEGGGAVIGRADLDVPDVTNAGRPSLRIGLQDNVGELLWGRQPAERLDIELIGRISRHRRLIQNASGDLHVLRLQRRKHFTGVELVSGHLVRIGVANRSVASSQKAAKELDIPKAYGDWTEIITDKTIAMCGRYRRRGYSSVFLSAMVAGGNQTVGAVVRMPNHRGMIIGNFGGGYLTWVYYA